MVDELSNAAEAIATLRQLIAGSGPAFVIYDLEVTSWEGSLARRWGGPGEFPEIIEIGAVKLTGAPGYTEFDSFSCLIRPTRNPILSNYIVSLTGITQEDVDARGIPFAEALAAFARFVGACRAFSNGLDDQWMAANCALHVMENPLPPAGLVNIGPQLRQAIGWSGQVFSNELPGLLGQANPGRPHEGLADARAVAVAVRHVLATPISAVDAS